MTYKNILFLRKNYHLSNTEAVIDAIFTPISGGKQALSKADLAVWKRSDGTYLVVKDRYNTPGRIITKEELFLEAI